MRRDPRVRLTDILRSIDQIRTYTDGLTREGFMDDPLVQDAVIRRLEIIGEAVKGLGHPERSRHPEVPWGAIAGTRDKLIHDYYLVDHELVWEMVQEHLTPLREAVTELMRANDQDST